MSVAIKATLRQEQPSRQSQRSASDNGGVSGRPRRELTDPTWRDVMAARCDKLGGYAEVARQIGVHRGTVTKVLNGSSNSPETIIKMCNFTGLPPPAGMLGSRRRWRLVVALARAEGGGAGDGALDDLVKDFERRAEGLRKTFSDEEDSEDDLPFGGEKSSSEESTQGTT